MNPAHPFRKPERDLDEPIRQGVELRPSGIHPKAPARTQSRNERKWIVVKQFIREDHHYQVRRRPVELKGENAALTCREEQVLDAALSGESNKSIAYTLGVSPSTVGVLLFRAAGKMGVKSRSELLSAYARRKSGSGLDATGQAQKPEASPSGVTGSSGTDGVTMRQNRDRVDSAD